MRRYLPVFAFVFCFALAARADTTGVVAVDKPPGPTATQADLTAQLRSALAERAPGVLEASELRDRMTGKPAGATLAELDRAYAGALATYQNGDFEGSVKTLRALLDDLEKLPDGPDVFAQWTRATMRLARVEQALGHKDAAKTLLETLVRAAPGIKADATQYPPAFEKQLRAAEAELRKGPTGKLTVRSSPQGATVFVNGRDVGQAPVTLPLPLGKYRVSGKLGEVNVPRVTADLTKGDGQSVELNFAVADALRPNLGPGLALLEGERQADLIGAGAFLGLDRVVATSLGTQGDLTFLAAGLYDVRRGMLLREGRVRVVKGSAAPGSIPALAAFLVSGQPSDLVATNPRDLDKLLAGSEAQKGPAKKVPPGALGAKAPAPPPKQPSKAMGFIGLGAGALALGLGGFAVYEGTQAKNSYSSAQGLLQGDTKTLQSGADPARFKDYVSSGDSAKNRAFIATGAAAALAVVSGVLLVLSAP